MKKQSCASCDGPFSTLSTREFTAHDRTKPPFLTNDPMRVQAIVCHGYLLLPCHLHDSPHCSCTKLQAKGEGGSPSAGAQPVVASEMTDGSVVERHLSRSTDQYM